MNKLLYLLFLSIFLLDYFALKLNLISDYIALLPDVLSMIAMVMVVALASNSKNAFDRKWVIFISIYICCLFIGVILNTVSPGALIVGIRSYFKYLPFFFIPIVYQFSDEQVGKQLKLLLLLSLMQGPLAIVQKFIQFGVTSTGDRVTGTLSSSGQLPILLACAAAVVTAFYLRNRINAKVYIIFLFLLVVPTTLSESKTSIGFIPLAFLVPIYINARMSGQKKVAKKSIAIFLIFVVTAVVFVAVYDHFSQYGRASRQGGLVEFFASGGAEKYLNRGAVDKTRITKLGYYDIIALPLDRLSNDTFKLTFGLGIGNVQGSAIGNLKGEYSAEVEKYSAKSSAVALFLWEIGIIGVLLYFVFIYMVFIDAKKLSKDKEIDGIIGLGWSAAMIVTFISLFFKNPFLDNVNGYLFWYFSGYVVAARYRLDHQPSVQQTEEIDTSASAVTADKKNGRILAYKK